MNRFMPKSLMESLEAILFLLIIPTFLLYNLKTSPLIWHDEGNAMLLAKTVAEDVFYGVRNSNGYQTFGAVQSVGPTVILPVALSFKIFGVGILQGRLIGVIYSYLTLLVSYKLVKKIFYTPSAILGMFLLLGSASSQFLYFGRQVLGEVPALGFFLGGWYCWLLGKENKQKVYFGMAGFMIGLSMITKSSYVVIGGGTLGFAILAELIYYRQRNFALLFRVSATSVVFFVLWVVFQWQYYGLETFQTNLDLMGQLGRASTGFSVGSFIEQVKFLIGSKNEYFYFLWSIPALIYSCVLCVQKDDHGFITAVLVLFVILWLMYYLYSVPWPAYLFAPAAVMAFFVGRLFFDILSRMGVSYDAIILEIKNRRFAVAGLFFALCVELLVFVFYPLQNAIQFNVLAQDDTSMHVARFIKDEVDADEVIETWERELGILADHQYHYPDQAFLIKAHAAKYRNASQDYLLSNEYFETIKPAFVVIGRFAREFQIYDPLFLQTNSNLIAQFGEGLTSYEIYEINYPLVIPQQ